MAKVYSIDGITPVVDPSAYVHPSAVLIGDVIVGPCVDIGPTASLRGDFGRLVVERGANIQDGCVLHGFPGYDTVIGENGHIGHGAVIHGCRIGRDALIGMNAVINDNAQIGESAIVSAMAFVKAGMIVPPRTLVSGIPGRVIRELSEAEIAWKREGTDLYQKLAIRCLTTMKETESLAAEEPGRKRIDIPGVMPLSEMKKKLAR